MKKINIPLAGHSYDVLIGYNIFNSISVEAAKRKLNKNILVVIDKNVLSYHSARIKAAIKNTSQRIKYLVIEPGEGSKSVDGLERIYNYLITAKYGRDSVIIAIGGGVVGDLAGFAAATFMRGIKFIQVPTTLLAAVDSSVGGKTGINFNSTKNIIGAFYQPELVITDLMFLNSLPDEEILCGFGEILKYSFLSGYDFFNKLKNEADKVFARDITIIEKLIRESVSIKKSVVLQDEKEAGLRKILNFGHTFAHAFESEMNFSIKHGEAVIAGIICALRLSYIKGLMTGEASETFINFASNYIRTKELKNIVINKVYDIMLNDKKNTDGKIKFVLIAEPGQIFLDFEAEKKEVVSVLNYFKDRI